jgi:uncharacterized protein involved in exopolysaccharide biosynthesis
MKSEQSNSPQEILKLAAIHYKVIVVIVLVCTVVAYMQTREMRPSYESAATLVVDTQNFVESETTDSTDVRDLDILTTLVGRIETTPVLQHVIEISPDLQNYYDVDLNDAKSINKAVEGVRSVIGAKLRGDSLFIDLIAKSGNRDLTYWAAKYTSMGFTNYLKLNSRSRAMEGVEQLKKGKNLAQTDLKLAQANLIEFNTTNNVTNLEERKTQLDSKNNSDRNELSRLTVEVTKLTGDLKKLESLGFQQSNLSESIELTDSELEILFLNPSVAANEDFISINRQFKAAKSDVRNLEVDLLDGHPNMKEAIRNVKNVRRVLIETIAEIPKNIYAKIDHNQSRVEELTELVDNQTTQIFVWEKLYMEQNTLLSDVEIANTLIESVKEEIQTVEFSTEAEGTQIDLVEIASEPSTIKPNKNGYSGIML